MNRKIKQLGLAVLRYFPTLRQATRKNYYGSQEKKYRALAESTPTNPKKIFFESFGGRQYACSPRAIYEAMLEDERFNDYEFIWSYQYKTINELSKLPEMERATIVERGSDAYWKACAECGYWILNNRMPEYFFPKSDQVYVQCWHGTPLKRLGADVPKLDGALNTAEELAERFALDAEKWTYLLSPSAYTSLHLADAFSLPQERRANVILEQGYPRNDRIVNESHSSERVAELRKELCEKLGLDPSKKLLLYAPTWRDDLYKAGQGYVLDETMMDFTSLRDDLEDEWCILFRAHYYITNQFDFAEQRGFIGDASTGVDINDLYIIADALLTDYSSVFFDFANTGRPMMFYWPDYEHYARDLHGFYFDLHELPGPQCTTSEEVVRALKEFDHYEERYSGAYQEFLTKFCPLDDGKASQRVIDAVFFS